MGSPRTLPYYAPQFEQRIAVGNALCGVPGSRTNATSIQKHPQAGLIVNLARRIVLSRRPRGLTPREATAAAAFFRSNKLPACLLQSSNSRFRSLDSLAACPHDLRPRGHWASAAAAVRRRACSAWALRQFPGRPGLRTTTAPLAALAALAAVEQTAAAEQPEVRQAVAMAALRAALRGALGGALGGADLDAHFGAHFCEHPFCEQQFSRGRCRCGRCSRERQPPPARSNPCGTGPRSRTNVRSSR